MATWYSQHFATAAAPDTLVSQQRTPVGLGHGRTRTKIMRIDFTAVFALNDVIRMGTFKSSDRIIELMISAPDMGTTGDFDIGLYLTGSNHDGAVVDDNLFCDALDVNAAASSRVEAFTEAALDDFDRGKMIWELLGLSADPMVQYDLAIVVVEATTATSGTVQIEAVYTSGD